MPQPVSLAAGLRGLVPGRLRVRRGTLSPGLRVSLGEYVDGACRQHCRRGVVEMFRWQATAPECQDVVRGRKQFWFVALGVGKSVVHGTDAQRGIEGQFARDLVGICRPPDRFIRKLRSAIRDLPDFVVPGAGAELAEAAPPPPTVTFPEQRRDEVRRGVQTIRYKLWFHVDCAVLSRHLRDIRNIANVSRDALIAMLGDQGGDVWDGLQRAGFRWPSRRQVARDRIRLDFACMLYARELFRRGLRQPMAQRTFREVLFDGSRAFGREALAIRENTLEFDDFGCAPRVSSVRFPTICVGHGQVTAADKGHAVVHAACLLRGPGKRELEDWVASVRCVPTDLGAETMVCNAANVLPAFFQVPPRPRAPPYLFPFGVRLAGWQHVCHNIVEDTVSQTFSWFPGFVRVFHEVQDFVRTRDYVDTLARSLRQRGHDDIVASLSKYTGRFVESRWGSLVESCHRLAGWEAALRAGWDESLFNIKSGMLEVVRGVCVEGECATLFWQRCSYLVAVFRDLESLRSWGAG